MNKTPKVSIIVPVYNVQTTLTRCINSIISQTYKDFEVILIDDGSTDNSVRLCDEFAQKYDYITVIHKQNEGLGPTRNEGIKSAKGEYIYHCDSDDWLSPTLLEETVKVLDETQSDFLIFGYTIYTEDADGNTSEYDKVLLPDCIIDNSKEVRQFFCTQYYNSFSVQSAWNRLYRKDFIIENNLMFPPLRRCQDMAYSLSLFSKANKIVCLREPFYNYIIEPGVFKGRSYEEMIATYLDIFQRTYNTFKSWDLLDETAANKLENKICEHVANYTAYAIVKKYPKQWRSNLEILFNNSRIAVLFGRYNGKSRFMRAFTWGVIHKSKHFLHWLSIMSLIRQKHA